MDEERFREIVREEITKIFHSDKFHFSRNMQIANGRNIEVGQSVGTMIGTSPDQRLGFFGATPRVQLPTGTWVQPTGGAVIDYEARAGVNDLMSSLASFGLHGNWP